MGKPYFGLRPRRAIRRWAMAGVAVLLLAAIVVEAVILLRRG